MVLLSEQQHVSLPTGWVPVLHEGEELNPVFSLVLCLEVFGYFEGFPDDSGTVSLNISWAFFMLKSWSSWSFVTGDCWLSCLVCLLCPFTCGAVMADLTDVIFITSRDDLVNTKFLCSESLFIFCFGMDCHFVLRFVDGMDLSFLMSIQCKQLFL